MFRKFLVLLAAALPAAVAADVEVVEEIIAKVNGEIITRGEMEHTRQELTEELRSQGYTGQRLVDAVRQRQNDALRNQIDQLLLVQKGKDLDLKVEGEVARRLAEIQVESKITDVDKFHEYVRQGSGMSFEDYKQQLTNQMLTQRVIGQEIGSRIAIPDAEKRKYYEEHKSEFVRQEQVFLSQILISTEGKTPEQVAAAEKRAADLVTRARKGEKFSELVRQYSDDPETSKNGGELPPYRRGMLRKEIEDVVFKQNKGYVTDPIKSPNGLLILKIDDRYEEGQASYEEVESQINEKLAAPQMEPKVREYLTKLRQNAFLQIKDGWVDSGAAPGKDTSWHDVQELKPQTVTKEEVAAQRKKKILGVIPHGTVGDKPVSSRSSVPAAAKAPPAAEPATPAADPAPPAAAPAAAPASTEPPPAAAPSQ
jgi:peptidyl-prolyl cis-trans isomerase SurA